MPATRKLHKDEPGADSAGQSGDLQQISDVAGADSESVEELLEEGNAFEAAAVDGVENAKDPDVSEVTTHQVREDDVPKEYLDEDEHVA
jgi:N utilization substance protein A